MSSDTYSTHNWQCYLVEPGHSDEAATASPDCSRRSRQMRSECGERPSAAAYSAYPMPLKFIASTCMSRTLKSDWTALRAHAVAIAWGPPEAVRRLFLVLTLRRFPGQIPQMFDALAQIFRAHQTARPSHQTCRRKIVFLADWSASSASIPCRNMVRPERIVGLCPGTARCHRKFSRAAGQSENSKWNENNIRRMCRTRAVT